MELGFHNTNVKHDELKVDNVNGFHIKITTQE